MADFVTADGRLQLQLTCFEPAPNQRSELQKRVGPVDREKVKLEINNIALSDYEGEAKFNITGPKTGTSHLRVDSGASGEATGDIITVQVTTADRFMEQNGIEKIDFMKIDTEGNDFRVIMGAERALQRQAIGLIQFEYSGEWVDHGHSIKSVMKFAAAYNYRVGRLTQNYIEQYDTLHLELDRFFLGNYVLLSPQVCLPADRVRKYTMDKYATAQEVRN